MIFWIASYPKSGNTWLRALISSYYYSEDGIFNQNIIQKIGQFPEKKHFENFAYDKNILTGTTNYWIKAQEKINIDKKLRFFKTHNSFGALNNNHFTDSKNSIGAIYIIRDPRNVITSLKNHYELSDDQALKWMINKKNYIYEVDNFEKYGYGNLVIINHLNGYTTKYAHNNRNLVKIGEKVRKGQVIAKMGSTGHSTGPHVHLEILKNNKHINPNKFIHYREKFSKRD